MLHCYACLVPWPAYLYLVCVCGGRCLLGYMLSVTLRSIKMDGLGYVHVYMASSELSGEVRLLIIKQLLLKLCRLFLLYMFVCMWTSENRHAHCTIMHNYFHYRQYIIHTTPNSMQIARDGYIHLCFFCIAHL